MEQKLVLKEVPRDPWMDEEEELRMEDRLNEGEAWEIAFEQGAQLANDEMVDDWYDEDEFE